MILDQRRAGILLHPTSLPGRFGIGDLGPECIRFLDWMREAGLGIWQVLPLGPTGYGDSPYQCFSAFAGNPLLVSPELLARQGLLTADEITPPALPVDRVDYGPTIEWKTNLLRKAWQRFSRNHPQQVATAFADFQARKEVKGWLEDYALFRVCKDLHEGRSWSEWAPALRKREKAALAKVRKEQADALEFHKFIQFLFFHQWEAVREAAKDRGILIVGDIPIYVAYDSADTWANQQFFQLQADGLPKAVAGVPPDYFSETGQLWGNPLYDWQAAKDDKYKWWIARLEAVLAMVDVVRVDHFRGFMGYWSVPFGEKTAVNGRWVEGPGEDFFNVIQKRFKDLPIIAEDLGEISNDVFAVRDKFNLPGMKVMQFAWGVASIEPLVPDPNNQFHLHHHTANCVVYTGTHDNDTTMGWWHKTSQESERHYMRVYLSTSGAQPHWDLIRCAFMSVANTAVVPMQDFLGLGGETRMNFPGRAEGNWSWRMVPEQLNLELARFIRSMTLVYQRCSNPPKEALPVPGGKKVVYTKPE